MTPELIYEERVNHPSDAYWLVKMVTTEGQWVAAMGATEEAALASLADYIASKQEHNGPDMTRW